VHGLDGVRRAVGAPHYTRRQTPRVASIPRTPPGPEGSKGKRALAGARGVLSEVDRGAEGVGA